MKFAMICLFVLYAIPAFAQDEEPQPVTQTQYTVDLGFSGIQFGAELKTGKTQTVQVRTGILLLVYDDRTVFEPSNIRLGGSYAVSAEYRYYYNFNERLKKHKDIRVNGANYFSFMALYATIPVVGKPKFTRINSVFMAGPMWGFNRPLGDKFYFHLSLGPVYQTELGENADQKGLTLFADIRWCFLLN